MTDACGKAFEDMIGRSATMSTVHGPWATTGNLDAQVRETHTGIVVLLGDRAYKVKKPVRTDFPDFSTPERREHACEHLARCSATRTGSRGGRRTCLPDRAIRVFGAVGGRLGPNPREGGDDFQPRSPAAASGSLPNLNSSTRSPEPAETQSRSPPGCRGER